MNNPPRGEELKRLNAHLNLLKVSAQDIPNMTVKVGPGNFWANGNSFIEFAGGNSPIITKPVTGSKYVCIVITKLRQLAIIDGPTSATLAVEPTLPQLNKDVLPLAIIYIKATTTIITNDMIYDARPLFNLGTFKSNHSDLDLRNTADAHTIEAITNLRAELDAKPTVNDIDNLLASKADNDGTTSNVFRINKDIAGEPDEDTTLEFHRGAESSAVIKYNEANKRLEFSNDGNEYYPLSSVEDIYNKSEVDILLTAKADIANVYSKIEIDNLLVNKTDSDTILAEIDTRIANLVNAAPETLDTLNELAAALNDDANFAATITTQINSKANALDVYTKTEIDTSLLTPKTIYVDKNRVDEYTSNGTMTKPFKTVQEALDVVSNLVGERIVINIAPGVYEETFALTINNSSIRINLNEALLKGNFTLTDATTIVNTSGLKIVGMGVRSSYDDPNFKNNCIEGNFAYHTLALNNMQTRLDFVNSGVIGDVIVTGGGKSRLWTFWTNSKWSGLMSTGTGTFDCGVMVCAYNVNHSTGNSIGSASGMVVPYKLYSCIIKGTWNISIAQGTVIWRNVIWDATNDFTGCTGTVNSDSNSAATFLDKASNPGSMTFSFADKSNTVGYTPTNTADWAVQPTTVGEAIDRIAAALALLKGSSI